MATVSSESLISALGNFTSSINTLAEAVKRAESTPCVSAADIIGDRLESMRQACIESAAKEIDIDTDEISENVAYELMRQVCVDDICERVEDRMFDDIDSEEVAENASARCAERLMNDEKFREMVANAVAKQLVDRMVVLKAAV